MLINCLLVVLSLVLHEFGHICSAFCFGIKVKQIGVKPLGLYVRRACSTGTPEVITCLAGVGVNALLAIAFWHYNWFRLVNVVFVVVNILPIKNSDGSHALEAIERMRK